MANFLTRWFRRNKKQEAHRTSHRDSSFDPHLAAGPAIAVHTLYPDTQDTSRTSHGCSGRDYSTGGDSSSSSGDSGSSDGGSGGCD